MNIMACKTEPIRAGQHSVHSLIDTYLPNVVDRSIIVITSKVVALCEGSVASKDTDKADLIRQEADYFLDSENNIHGMVLTIKRNVLIPTAGIDESNSADGYVLWPRHPQAAANSLRQHVARRDRSKQIGVIITDSKTMPLRRGTTGIALAHSGFRALNSYIGKPDIFGRPMKVTQANLIDGLAAAAVLVMGEGREQTPLAIIEDVPFIHFQRRNPRLPELDQLAISLEDDIYAPLLKNAPWQVGGGT